MSLCDEITIIYAANPLENIISLSEIGKLCFKQKFAFYFLINEYLFYQDLDQERTNKYIKSLEKLTEISNKPDTVDSVIDQICKDFHFDSYFESLSKSHEGDCCKIAVSCIKCISEEILGINTTESLSSRQKSYLYFLYNKHHLPSPQKAILKIKEELNIPGQDQELLLSIIEYLENYIKKTHFQDVPMGWVYLIAEPKPYFKKEKS